MADWVEGRVVSLRRWTDTLYSLRLQADIPPFRAGQFTRLALELEGELVARPYSFVNGPDEPLLEFCFVRVPDGPLTARLVALGPGDRVLISPRSAGFFVLDEVPAADVLWMLSTGTAIGPFLSILATAQAWHQFRHLVLVHAVRYLPELTYRDQIEALRAAHPQQLSYIPFVSREDTGFAVRGRITAALESGALEQRAGLALAATTSQVMICGNPDMVADTQRVLEARGMKKNRRREPGQITTEQYWKT
ncbi:MAG: ferredoxin--NADP reductase [Pseudomonadota bacterium]